MKFTVFLLLLSWLAFAADAPPKFADQGRTLIVHERDVVTIYCRVNESTLLILPEGEQTVLALIGDKDRWSTAGSPSESRFIAVKPDAPGLATDLHIVTNHGNSYSFRLVEVSRQPDAVSDAKIFINPDQTAESRIKQAPVFVPAAQAEQYKQEAERAKQQVDALTKQSQQTVQAKTDQFRASYPDTLRFDYSWNHSKAAQSPFNVSAVYRDQRFTYIKANPQEAPALYEIKDGKPSLIAFNFANGLYTVPKILDAGYLQIGKKKMTFRREQAN